MLVIRARPGRRDGGARPRRPSRRGVRGHRRAGGLRPTGTVHRDAQRRAVADLLPVRLRRATEGVAGDGRRRRGAGRHLPLAHRHRGLPEPHRHLLRVRAGRALRADLHPRPRRARAAQLPHRRRRRHRGTRHRRRAVPREGDHHGCHRLDPHHPAHPHRRREARHRLRRHAGRRDQRPGGQLLRDHRPADRRQAGKLHRFVNIYVNDEDVRFSGGLDTVSPTATR